MLHTQLKEQTLHCFPVSYLSALRVDVLQDKMNCETAAI